MSTLHPNDWALPMDAQGVAYGRDHELGIYNVGNKDPHPIPKEYHLSTTALASEQTATLPHLKKIELHQVEIVAKVEKTATHAAIPAKLTAQGEQQFYQLLEKAIGLKKEDLVEIPPPLIGEGGFNYVFKVCPKGKECFVAKIKKSLSGRTLSEAETQKIIEVFVHDAYMESKQEASLKGVFYLDPQTKGVAEFKVDDEVPRGFEPGYPNKQLAHVIKSPHPQSAEMGLITQEFIPWKPVNNKIS